MQLSRAEGALDDVTFTTFQFVGVMEMSVYTMRW